MSDIERLISEAIGEAMRREDAAIETAFERAIVTGTHGVKVVRRGGLLVSAEPDSSVPYGQIHEHLEHGNRWPR